MAGYFVANYTITNQAEYKEYLAAVGPILKAHGAENIVVDRDSEPREGSAGQVTIVLRFATKAAAKAQYTSDEFAVLAGDCQVALSTGRKGQCWDNALAESFFGSIKSELLDLRPWPTRARDLEAEGAEEHLPGRDAERQSGRPDGKHPGPADGVGHGQAEGVPRAGRGHGAQQAEGPSAAPNVVTERRVASRGEPCGTTPLAHPVTKPIRERDFIQGVCWKISMEHRGPGALASRPPRRNE